MNLILNGEPRSFAELDSLATLVERLSLDPRKVAIELNLEIVPRSLYAQTAVKNGDRLEIVQFVGGG